MRNPLTPEDTVTRPFWTRAPSEVVALTLQDGTPITLTIEYPEAPEEDGVSVTVTS